MDYGMEQLPGTTDRELLEGMTPEQIVDQILVWGEQVTRLEGLMSLGSDVMSGMKDSPTVDGILAQRERERNGETKATSP